MRAAAPSRQLDRRRLGARCRRAGRDRPRDLIRIPSINPPSPEAPDGELRMARYLATMLEAAGLEPEIVEPVPGRGSVHARLRGDGTGGDPLLLLSHLDVVPAPADRWTHDPFAADLVDGYIYGRGAVDMKAMVAMELGVVRMLASEARAAGLDPARDPIPGLRRDVLFTCTADEEAGGDRRGEMDRRAPAGVAARGRGAQRVRRRLGDDRRASVLPDPGRGEGLRRLPDRRPRDVGPRLDAARRQRRGARRGRHRASRRPGPDPGDAGRWPAFLELAAAELPSEAGRSLSALSGDDAGRAEAALAVACDPMYARAVRALLRDTISPDVIHAGVKYNVIPGDAVVEVDCRVLPGTTEPDDARHPGRAPRARARRRLRHRADRLRRPGRGAGGRAAVRPAGRDDPRPRPRWHPAPGHGAVRHRCQAHRRPGRPDLRVLTARGSTPTSASSSGSTGSTSASRSTPCAGACRSCTTWSAASAAEEDGGRQASGRGGCSVRHRLDDDLLVARRALVDRADAQSRSGSWSVGLWWPVRGSNVPHVPSV